MNLKDTPILVAGVLMATAPLVMGQEARSLPVPVPSGGLARLCADGSTVMIQDTASGVLWRPDQVEVVIPYRPLYISPLGDRVSTTDGQGVGIWGEDIGHHYTFLNRLVCGDAGAYYRPYLFPLDGSWVYGRASWNAAGDHECVFRVGLGEIQSPAFDCNEHHILALAADGIGHLSARDSSDVIVGVSIKWSGGGCITLPSFYGNGLYRSATLAANGEVAWVCPSYWDGTPSSVIRHAASGEALELSFSAPNALSNVQITHSTQDGNVALLRASSGGQADLFLYDHRLRRTFALSGISARAGALPYGTAIGTAEMDWSGTRFLVQFAPGQPLDRVQYVEIPPRCPSDLDFTFSVDSDDVIAFFNLFEAGLADIDNDGDSDSDDIVTFFQGFEAGC